MYREFRTDVFAIALIAFISNRLVSPHGVVAADQLSVADIEKVLLGPRDEIRTAAVEIISHLSDENGDRTIKRMVYVDFGRQRWRLDVTRPNSEKARPDEDADFTEISCMGCTPENHFVLWSTYRIDPRGPSAVAIYSSDDIPKDERRPSVDLRILGLTPTKTGNCAQFTSEDGSLDVFSRVPGSEQITEVEFRGKPHLLIAFKRPNGVPIRCWISPGEGYGLVRIEGGDPIEVKVECELERHAAVMNLWYPKLQTFETYRDGKVTEQEVATIKLSSLNLPISDEIFSLRGFQDLPKGTHVIYSLKNTPSRRPSEWNGEEIVPLTPPSANANKLRPTPSTPSRGSLLVWINVAVIAGVLTLYLFLRWRHSRQV